MANKVKQASNLSVDATPVKSFFVKMLTRDIKLEDAILDLLDNCVDGILRSKQNLGVDKPYSGFYADIEFNKSSFIISDNCGGIPWKLKDYAFRMGRAEERPKDVKGSVGFYGIGMKRAIFKIGRDCLISTQNKRDRYDVAITPNWINSEIWNFPVKVIKNKQKQDGTTIVIKDLLPGIQSEFGPDSKDFFRRLELMVATHYAFIIDKGFTVRINKTKVKPRPTKLVFARGPKNGMKPYIFKGKIDGVEIFLTVGFTMPIPSQSDLDDDQKSTRYSSLEAGWTVICNDRAVLYCDRTELTGWGESTVPRYHNQFIAISGIVEFKGESEKLPTTTTKRGIDASSSLYLKVKNKMRDGMLLFISYTNKWKGLAAETKRHMENQDRLSLEQIKMASNRLTFTAVTKHALSGKQFKPSLPQPKKTEKKKARISFEKNKNDIKRVAEYLFEDENISPSEVGEECFDKILKDAN